MAALIKQRRVVTETSPSPSEGAVVPASPAVVPAAGSEGAVVPAEAGTPFVLRLEPTDDPAAYADRLPHVARVEVNFPKFGDGRGFSIGRLLRERYGYKGELRAVGHLTRDLLFFLESVGFDAFELRPGEDPHAALAAFEDFSESYQASPARPIPLFRRRRG